MARPRGDRAGTVYFVLVPDTNRVKIGWALDGQRRTTEIARMCGGESEVLGFVPGTQRDESRMHRRLKSHRTHGEWFIFSPPVWLAIWRAIRFGTCDYDAALADWQRVEAEAELRLLGNGIEELGRLAATNDSVRKAFWFLIDCGRFGIDISDLPSIFPEASA
jgi:hypothetical protein